MIYPNSFCCKYYVLLTVFSTATVIIKRKDYSIFFIDPDKFSKSLDSIKRIL